MNTNEFQSQEAKNIFNIEQFNGSSINLITESNQGFNLVEANRYADLAAPELVDELLKDIQKQSILLISGDLTFDKNTLLRYVAYELYTLKPTLQINEWFGGAENSSLFQSLRSLEKPSILVIDKLMPQDFQFDFQRLLNEIQSNGHFLLASSDSPKKIWHLDSKFNSLFREIEEKDIAYNDKTIRKLLQQKLDLNRHQYTFEITNTNFNAGNLLSGAIKVKDLSALFSTPEQVDAFIRLLARENEVINQKTLEFLAKRASEEDQFSLSSWFGPLEESEKLSALSLVLFEGFADDQFFSAVQMLANESWGEGYPELKSLDYKDILPLLNVFKLESSKTSDGPQSIIVGRYPDQQMQMLETIWYSHRRHLIRALPTLVRLTMNSIDDLNSNMELYGSVAKRRRLRRSIAQTLSFIGKKSKETVEPILLELASHDNRSIQSVAAKAMAQWYLLDQKDGLKTDLFILLNKWRTETRILDFVAQYISNNNSKDSANTYIKATVILTVGYAVQYDHPKTNNEEALDLLFSFLPDKNGLVRNRLKYALPHIIKVYGVSISPAKWDILLSNIDLLESIALGMVWAWQNDPQTIEKHLVKELNSLNSFKNAETQTERLKRDRKTAYLSTCLGLLIQQEDKEIELGGNQAINLLWQLREETPNPLVKELIWQIQLTYGALPCHLYGQIEQRVGTISKEENKNLIEALGKKYLEERVLLKGGDETVKIKKESFDIWIDSKREETPIEKLMYSWLLGETSSKSILEEEAERMLQQIAFMAFQEFARVFEYWESTFIKEELKQRVLKKEKADQEAKAFEYQRTESAMIPLNHGVFGKLWSNLFGTEKSKLIQSLKNIIKNSPNVDLNMILLVSEKWKNKNEEFKKVAYQIEKTIKKQNDGKK